MGVRWGSQVGYAASEAWLELQVDVAVAHAWLQINCPMTMFLQDEDAPAEAQRRRLHYVSGVAHWPYLVGLDLKT